MQEIVDFIDIGEAIDRPLRTYSSGMRARLHFGIATAVIPRILLIDEALSVGDKHFREKSSERIDKMLEAAGTLLLVSHSLPELRARCTRGIWIEKGLMRMDGPIEDVIKAYEAEN
jgi:teichoic acid transport system ATP-binding protein